MKLDQLQLDDSYVRSLPADPLEHPGARQVYAAC